MGNLDSSVSVNLVRYLTVLMIVTGYIQTCAGSLESKVIGKLMYIGNGTRIIHNEG